MVIQYLQKLSPMRYYYNRVSFCAPGSGPTLQQSYKTSRIFAENERILRVATEVASLFIGLLSKEKDL